MSNRVIKMSSRYVAATLLSAALVGCGGGGSGSNGGAQIIDPQRSATLSWNAPAARENGEGLAMGELKGYVIHYGQSEDSLSQQVEISDASVMDYTIGGLSEGEWYFSVQVVDTSGLKSAPSQLVSKTI